MTYPGADPFAGYAWSNIVGGTTDVALYRLVSGMRYKPGWSFSLHAGGGPTLFLRVDVDTVDPVSGERALISHRMPVPLVRHMTDDEWIDWLFEQVLLIERHETGEFFTVDGHRPYLPEHGPNVNPYALRRRQRVDG